MNLQDEIQLLLSEQSHLVDQSELLDKEIFEERYEEIERELKELGYTRVYQVIPYKDEDISF